MKDIDSKIGEYWSNVTNKMKKEKSLKTRWWQSHFIIRHINNVISGEVIPGVSAGLVNLVKLRAGNKVPFDKAISVGGGAGQKEMSLLKQGLVKHFDLYELSEARISTGRELAKKQGLEEKINFIHGDAFSLAVHKERYDFVHWNNSLHHMLDVDEAVKWSKNVLKVGGLFYMDDFIGASRFQWPDKQLDIATKVRQAFDDSDYLKNPRAQGLLPTKVGRPNKELLIQDDPSEAADSDRIVASINKYFPNAEIKNTGGVVYHLALSEMLHNFDDEKDEILLNLLMIIDELCADLGETHYGIALAFKES